MNPDFDLVPIISMTDPGTFAIAQDILKSHGIRSFLRGEPHAWGFAHPVPMPFHTSFGPVLLVERRHAKAAANLLAGMLGPSRRPKGTAKASWIHVLVNRLRHRRSGGRG